MAESINRTAKGRGSQIEPPNRFASIHVEDDWGHTGEELAVEYSRKTEYLSDNSKSIISENDSPDIGFRYSLNPYRGCAHGCVYCYARPTHEYLGLNAGLDFETKVLVKHKAADLFRDWLARDRWQPELIVFSGVTDCYQLAERQFGLTRQCLEVAAEARQPCGIITKNALIARDLDVLTRMNEHGTIHVAISITTLDESLAHSMEPRTSPPAARLKAIQNLAGADIPTSVMVAPVIPGLNDSEIPAILAAAAEAGASSASYQLLRLPLAVRPIFIDWLERTRPDAKSRIEARIQDTRGGELNSAKFGERMRGTGVLADQINQTFEVFARKYGLNKKLPPLDTTSFRRPQPTSGQLRLF